jgi:hypothetical protein
VAKHWKNGLPEEVEGKNNTRLEKPDHFIF